MSSNAINLFALDLEGCSGHFAKRTCYTAVDQVRMLQCTHRRFAQLNGPSDVVGSGMTRLLCNIDLRSIPSLGPFDC